jgi:hypothetical protein
MSVTGMFNSIPPGSSLYACIEREISFRHIIYYLLNHGDSIYTFFDLESDEVNEILEAFTEYATNDFSETFPSEESVRQAISQYRSEVIKTRQDYPGIENRNFILYGTTTDIIKLLTNDLARKDVENAKEVAKSFLFGDKVLGHGDGLEVISRQSVSKGVGILQQINPEALFSKDQVQYITILEEFEELRNFYLAVDENNEEILVAYE